MDEEERRRKIREESEWVLPEHSNAPLPLPPFKFLEGSWSLYARPSIPLTEEEQTEAGMRYIRARWESMRRDKEVGE